MLIIFGHNNYNIYLRVGLFLMDEKYMAMALKQAKIAYNNGDIPVGVVIEKDGKVLAKAYNKKALLKNPIKHAEIIAIENACKKVGDFRLEGANIYVTKEPCIMCLGAILSARIDNVYFGAYDKKYSILDVVPKIQFNHKSNLVGGVMEKECSKILSDFFEELRCKHKH